MDIWWERKRGAPDDHKIFSLYNWKPGVAVYRDGERLQMERLVLDHHLIVCGVSQICV